MRAVLEELRRAEEPTTEEFVDAVIRTHERIQSKLRALARNADPHADRWTGREAGRPYPTEVGGEFSGRASRTRAG